VGTEYQLCHTLERSESFSRPDEKAAPAPHRYRTLRVYSVRRSLTGYWRHQHPGGGDGWVSEGARYQLENQSLNPFIPGRDPGDVPDVDRFGLFLWVDRKGSARRTPAVVPEAVASIPYWVPAMVAAVVPGLHAARLLWQRHRESRGRRGLCCRCGYDLRGGHARCPECGLEPPAPKDVAGTAA